MNIRRKYRCGLQSNVLLRVADNHSKPSLVRGKSRSEKLALITQYVNAGYFVTEEVKGATPGNQHWVAVTGVNGNNVIMVDPASNQTDMWSAYEWSKSSQFNYFKAE